MLARFDGAEDIESSPGIERKSKLRSDLIKTTFKRFSEHAENEESRIFTAKSLIQ